MSKVKLSALAGATLILASCGGQDAEPAPDPDATPETEATASIFSPETDPGAIETQIEALEATVGFPDGGSELDESAKEALRGVLASEQMAENAPVVLRGHSDAGGSDDANMRASQTRAEVVRDWLTENGVSEDRISIIAFGEQNPVQPNANPDGTPNETGRAANRRVEIRVTLGGTTPDDAVNQDRTTDEAAAEDEDTPAREPLIPLVD